MSWLMWFILGMVAGFWLASACGLAKEADRQAEMDFLRMRLRELERE